MSDKNEKEKESKSNKSLISKEKLDGLKERLNKTKNEWLNAEGFDEFLSNSLKNIVTLTIYFYLGINFNLLGKSIQLNPGGLKGQNLNGAPYIGNFSECSMNDFDVSKPISDWSFPYKNPVLCNADANRNRPLYFRFVSWSVSVLAFSYAMGKKLLNMFFSGTDDTTVILFGPILTVLIIAFTPFVSLGLSWTGIFTNIDKMLPKCYYSFWFPLTTACLFLWGMFTYPVIIMLVQFISIVYFLLFHATFNKIDILENGEKKTMKGIVSIIKRIISNSTYFLLFLVIIAINAYNHLGKIFALPLIGWIGFYIFTKYMVFLLE
jgi:hypothetical protein